MFNFRQSVDSIIADIQAKVKALNVAAEFHAAEADAHREVILAKNALIGFADAEYTRAKAIAAKLEALIS